MTDRVLASTMEESESGILLLAPLVTGSDPVAGWDVYSPVFLPPLRADAFASDSPATDSTPPGEAVSPDAGWSASEPVGHMGEGAEPVTTLTPEPAGDEAVDRASVETRRNEEVSLSALAEVVPLADADEAEVVPFTGADEKVEFGNGDDAGWRDELPVPPLGETEPEDELPFLAADAAFPITPAHPAGPRTEALAGPAALIDRVHVEDLAARLEDIAGVLREQGPARLLLGQARDPLSALITGYLVGYLESQGRAATADTNVSG